MVDVKAWFTEDEIEDMEHVVTTLYDGSIEEFVHDAAVIWNAAKKRELELEA